MKKVPSSILVLILVGIVAAAGWQIATEASAPPPVPGTPYVSRVTFWEPLVSDKYNTYEKVALVANVIVALAGLGYALMLVGQVQNAPNGTPRMQEIARAMREGADAYLYRQFRVVGVLIVIITVVLYFAAMNGAEPDARDCLGPRHLVPRGLDLLRDGRLRRHAAWPPSATSAWPPPRRPASGRPCSSATAPARSPAC